MIHHFIKQQEQTDQCLYCGSILTMAWVSEFIGKKHYKTSTCECGKKHRVTVGFDGSGHDSWDKTIESRLGEKNAS